MSNLGESNECYKCGRGWFYNPEDEEERYEDTCPDCGAIQSQAPEPSPHRFVPVERQDLTLHYDIIKVDAQCVHCGVFATIFFEKTHTYDTYHGGDIDESTCKPSEQNQND